MNKTKELEIALNMLKSGFSYITLDVVEADTILDYIKELEKKIEEQEKIIEDYKCKSDFYNARLIATWQETKTAHIYRKYYMLFNGSVYNLEVYSNSENYLNLGVVPTYLNADIQMLIKGKHGLAECKPVDYYTFKRVYSGV